MYANSIRSVSEIHLKFIVRAAILQYRRQTTRQNEYAESNREDCSPEWNYVLSYVERLGLLPQSVFPIRSALLWESLDDLNVASSLVRSGTNLNEKRLDDKTRSSLLHVLTSSKDTKKHELASLMVAHGADVNDRDAEGNTPLHAAIENEAIAVVAAILKSYGDRKLHFLVEGRPGYVIGLAVQSPSYEKLLPLFFQHCAYLDNVRHCCEAVTKDMSDDRVFVVLKIILRYGYVTSVHQNILFRTFWRNAGMAKLLIGYRNNANEKVFDLQLAFNYPFVLTDPDMLVYLVREGADVNGTINYTNEYPLHLACQNRSAKIVRLLLQLGANVTVTDQYGLTPLLCRSEEKVARILVKQIARLRSAGEQVHKEDMLHIRYGNPNLRQFYESCVKELCELKSIEVAKSIFGRSIYELSLIVKNNEILKQLRKSIRQIQPSVFPIFKADLIQKLEIAMKMRKFVVSRERELQRAFSGFLPCIVVRMIAEYSVDLVNFEREYYASCFKRKL